MPDVELRADFDRDGHLSRTPREYDARGVPPGAIIGANLDRDDRRLPNRARVARPVQLDYERPTRVAQDNDPLPLLVTVKAAAVARFTSLTLRVRGDNADGVALLDARRRPVTATSSAPDRVDYPLPLTAGVHRFRIEGKRVPATPLGRLDAALVARVIGRDAAGEHVVDEGRFLLARFIVLGDLNRAEALYICDVSDNFPALRDVRAAMRTVRPGVALREIRAADNRGDAWVQDQFQLGYVSVPGRATRTVLHMPRLRTNAQLGTSQQNLAGLVRTYFPSAGLGLIDDYWKREITVTDVSGSAQTLTFEESEAAYRVMHRAEKVYVALRDSIERLCAVGSTRPSACARVPVLVETIPSVRGQIPRLLRLIEQIARELSRGLSGDDRRRIQAVRDQARAIVRKVRSTFPMSGPTDRRVFDLVLARRRLRLDGDELLRLHTTVERMHDALVYGGNVEASPAMPGSPFGKVVLGEGNQRLLDPAVRDLFDANAHTQPVVTLDTGWLHVGHVDEVMAFLPDRGEDQAHVILRASPAVAMELIDEASDLYHGGLPIAHPDKMRSWRPMTLQRHVMRSGSHPMTRLLRGKLWFHWDSTPTRPDPEEDEGRARGADPGQIMPPPNIYLRIVDWFDGLLKDDNAPYRPDRSGTNHYYPAALSAWELQYFEGGTNGALEANQLRSIDEELSGAFESFALIPVPVIFDRIVGDGRTSAFTPNLVNLQFVNGTALIPNPFGPRMRPNDAVTVIRAVLRARGLGRIAGRVTPRYFRRHRLDRLRIRMNPQLGSADGHAPFTRLGDLAREFRDGFPDKTRSEVERILRRANPGVFDGSGRIRSGWQRLNIPEGTVDLFQAYTHVIVDALGVRPAWIDTWYYHVRLGEIHCGTNVLRRPPRRGTNWWSGLTP